MKNSLLVKFLLVGCPMIAVGAQETGTARADSIQSQSLLLDSFSREMSGTAWQPGENEMQSMLPNAKTSRSLDAAAFGFYDHQSGRRGSSQLGSLNWAMGTFTTAPGSGSVRLRGMMSAEPFTLPGDGYPILLQSGEVYQNTPIHDRQHPHDLFMELSATYAHALGRKLGISLYLAPVGEPASGPAAYSHRMSAADNPFTPIAHHWQDASHISFGVATVGLFTQQVKLEGSVFNGAEPDQIRTNFDYRYHRMNSLAGRLTVMPSDHWTMLASYAFVKDPEPVFGQDSLGKLTRIRHSILEDDVLSAQYHLIIPCCAPVKIPKTDLHRIVISSSYAGTIGVQNSLAVTGTFSRQRHDYDLQPSMSVSLEGNLSRSMASVFTRVEFVQKTIGDLALPPPRNAKILFTPAGAPADFSQVLYDMGEATAGIEATLRNQSKLHVAIGAAVTVNDVPGDMAGSYGSFFPVGYAVYVHIKHSGGHHESVMRM